MTINTRVLKNILFLILGASVLSVATVNAQYYYPNNYNYGNNYSYNYGNNPNNGVTSFVGDYGYNNYNYGNYNNGYYGGVYLNSIYGNCGSGYYWNGNSCVTNSNYNYYNNSYVQPVSVALPVQNYNYNYNNGYYGNCYNNNCGYYNNSTLIPTTYAATGAYQTGATINGYVTVSGNNYNNNYGTTWFQYGLNSNSLNWSTNPANVYNTTNSNAHLTGLTCSTTYYFRAVTSGQNGMQYGNTLSFMTSPCSYGYYPNQPQYWTPPQIQTSCYKPAVKKVVKKRYYR